MSRPLELAPVSCFRKDVWSHISRPLDGVCRGDKYCAESQKQWLHLSGVSIIGDELHIYDQAQDGTIVEAVKSAFKHAKLVDHTIVRDVLKPVVRNKPANCKFIVREPSFLNPSWYDWHMFHTLNDCAMPFYFMTKMFGMVDSLSLVTVDSSFWKNLMFEFVERVRGHVLAGPLPVPDRRGSGLKVLYFVRHRRQNDGDSRRLDREVIGMLEKALVRESFEVKVLETFDGLSFSDVLKMMWDTDVLIGLHGNGLSNAAFMRRDCVMVELLPEVQFKGRLFETVASTAGLRYAKVDVRRFTADKGKLSATQVDNLALYIRRFVLQERGLPSIPVSFEAPDRVPRHSVDIDRYLWNITQLS